MRCIGLLIPTLVSVVAAPLQAQSSPAVRLQVSHPDARLWASSAPSPLTPPIAVPTGTTPAPLPSAQVDGRSAGTLVAVGLLAAAGSFIGGAYLGGMIENEFAPCSCDDPGLRGALRGAALTPPLVVPVAVHLANGRRGSFLRTLGGSLLGGAAVAAVALASNSLEIGVFGTPIGALIGSVVAEVTTTGG
jgi:hypothetical protein